MKPVRLADICRFRPTKFLPELIHGSDRARVFLLCLEPEQGLPARADCEEMICYCVEGKATLTLGDETVSLSAGQVASAEAGMVRGMKAEERCVTVWVQVSVCSPHPCPSGVPSTHVERVKRGEANGGRETT